MKPKLAVVFAGQGSQHPGMGLPFAALDPRLETQLDQASRQLGYDVRQALLDEQKIHQTIYTQPLLLLSAYLAYQAACQHGLNPAGFAGFSLGEYTALLAAGVFDFTTMIDLIQKRAIWMNACATEQPGGMAAIIGLHHEAVEQACKDASTDTSIVVPANYNTPVQLVISGHMEALVKAMDICQAKGARRTMMLKVSGAFHSPLMKKAGDKLNTSLAHMTSHVPECPVYLNTTALPMNTDTLVQEMSLQCQTPVRFVETIQNMAADGFTHFVEIGPGRVLSGLINKINPALEVITIDQVPDLNLLKGWLDTHGFKR